MDHVIVLGTPRSGTTYLMRLLNTLPDSECLIGTLVSSSIPQIARQPIPDQIYDALAVSVERSLDAYMHSGRFLSRSAALQKWFNAPNGPAGLVSAIRGERYAKRLIYKEPFLSFAPEFVSDALPDARIIYIYRDGRDVANSLDRSYGVLTDDSLRDLRSSEMRLGRRVDHRYVPWWVDVGQESLFLDSSPFARAIWMWDVMVSRCFDFYRRPDVVSSERVLEIRYEDLMREPDSFGAVLLDHIGERPNAAFHRMLSKAHVRSIGKYRRRPMNEIEEAERIAGDTLVRLGFERSV